MPTLDVPVLPALLLAPPPTTITDSFNRADSSSSMGNTDTGQTWVPNSGTWGIASNKAYCVNSESQRTTVVESSRADCVVQVTLSTFNDSGLCWRSSDDSNHFISTATNAFRREAGSFTSVGSNASAMTNGDVIAVTLSGNSHSITKNGSAWISYSSSFNNTATKHGLRVHSNNTARFDDFSVL